MTYYKQKFKTDCLVAAAENFLQRPRQNFGTLEWHKVNNEPYLKYYTLAKLLHKFGGGAKILFDDEVELDNCPAIIGSIFTYNNSTICHSYYWDGNNLYCPHRDCFVDLKEIDARYIFVNNKYHQASLFPLVCNNIKKICKQWDDYISSKIPKPDQTKLKVDRLITLVYKEMKYPGDVERANTNRED